MREAVGKVAARPTLSVELTLEVGAEDACLHARQLRRRVDPEHPVQAAHVDRNHGPRLARLGLEAAGDARPAANGMTTAFSSRAAPTTAATSSSSAGRTTTTTSCITRPQIKRRRLQEDVAVTNCYTESYWRTDIKFPEFPGLEEDIHVDAVIVGAVLQE